MPDPSDTASYRKPNRGEPRLTSMWLLLRQDDNGNVFVVGEYPDEAAARDGERAYVARAHKQIYWIEPPRMVSRS